MAKNTVKVETDQLRACANNYKTYAQQYNDDWQVIENKLNECKNYWQGSFASDFEEVLKKVNKTKSYIYDNTIELANFMTQAADLYDKYNGDIARALREDTSKKANDYPEGVVASRKKYDYNGTSYTVPDGFSEDYNYHQYADHYKGTMTKACSLFAMATVLSMINGKKITPESLKSDGSKYWNSNGCTWRGLKSDTRSGGAGGYSAVYDSIYNQKKPCVIELKNSSNGSTHFVAAVGVKSGADPNNITNNDILVVDPATGKICTLAEAVSVQYNSKRNRDFSGRVITF